MNTQPDNQPAQSDRYIRFQFWLSDHGEPVLFNHWSDGYIEEASVMLPDRLVDLQHWDTYSGAILNHLVESGWQPGTMPYGIDPDEPIPEVQSDHETLWEPAREPPVTKKAPAPARTPQPNLGPLKAQAAAPQPRAQAQVQQTETHICVLPNPDIAKRSVSPHRKDPDDSPFSPISSWFILLVLVALVCSLQRLPRSYGPAALSSSPLIQPPSPSVPQVRRALPAVPRALPVLTNDDKPVARAQLVVAPRAQLVRLP